jgi:sugar-specific transcriptional regulator TrmB
MYRHVHKASSYLLDPKRQDSDVQARELETKLKAVEEELSRSKSEYTELQATQQAAAAAHSSQLAKDAKEKVRLEKEIENLRCKHNQAISVGQEVRSALKPALPCY